MKEENFTMYGEYAGIVGFVAGDRAEQECNIPNGEPDSDFDFGLAHLEEGHGAQYRMAQGPKRDTISAVLQYDNKDSVILVLGQPPFHIEYVSTMWANQFGWSSEEIMGLDLRFLQGDGAIGINIRALYDVAYTEKKKTSEITGYAKNGAMFSCTITCRPIYDIERVQYSRVLSNIAINFSNLKIFYDFPSSVLQFGSLNEIGMPLDRREYSASYKLPSAKVSGNKSFASGEFLTASRIIEQKPLSDVLRFMSTSETSTAVALTDRTGRMVSMNESFTNLFGVKIKDTEGKGLEFLFSELTDIYTRELFPSRDMMPYKNPSVSPREGNNKAIAHDNDRYSKEFTAVLYDSNFKTVTCRVVVLPTVISLLDAKKTGAVHFGVCIQKLFIEEMCLSMFSPRNSMPQIHRKSPKSVDKRPEKFVSLMLPFMSPEIFPERFPIEVDNFSWD